MGIIVLKFCNFYLFISALLEHSPSVRNRIYNCKVNLSLRAYCRLVVYSLQIYGLSGFSVII